MTTHKRCEELSDEAICRGGFLNRPMERSHERAHLKERPYRNARNDLVWDFIIYSGP